MDRDNFSNTDKKLWEEIEKTVIPLNKKFVPKNSLKNKIIPFKKEKNISYFNNQISIPNKILDLHGMSKNEAYNYLEKQLSICKIKKYKCVEIITGKGNKRGNNIGILKRKVPLWLEGVKFNSIIKYWKPVPGNEGAIYVFLK